MFYILVFRVVYLSFSAMVCEDDDIRTYVEGLLSCVRDFCCYTVENPYPKAPIVHFQEKSLTKPCVLNT